MNRFPADFNTDPLTNTALDTKDFIFIYERQPINLNNRMMYLINENIFISKTVIVYKGYTSSTDAIAGRAWFGSCLFQNAKNKNGSRTCSKVITIFHNKVTNKSRQVVNVNDLSQMTLLFMMNS